MNCLYFGKGFFVGKIKTILGLVVLCVVCGGRVAFAIDVAELRDILVAQEESIEDISIEYTRTHEPPMTKDDVAGTTHLYSIGPVKEKLVTARPFSERRLTEVNVHLSDQHGREFDSFTKMSFDGRVVKHLTIGGWPRTATDGTITKRTSFVGPLCLSPLRFTIFRDSPENIVEAIFEHPEVFRISDSEEVINGYETVCLELVRNGFVPRKYYFSPTHGYALVRLVHTRDDVVRFGFDAFELKQLENGFWFPMKGVIIDNEDDRKQVYVVNKVKVNQGLTAEDFDFEFPVGTRIINEIANTQYIVEADSKGSGAKENPDSDVSEPKSSNGKLSYYVVGGFLAAVVLIILFVTKRARGTGGGE